MSKKTWRSSTGVELPAASVTLTTVTPSNRMVAFPYPKYLNAIMEVDQSAGVLVASVAKARELGVPEDRWVYLHGCADAHDIWNPIDRQDFHSSPAMRLTGHEPMSFAEYLRHDPQAVRLLHTLS